MKGEMQLGKNEIFCSRMPENSRFLLVPKESSCWRKERSLSLLMKRLEELSRYKYDCSSCKIYINTSKKRVDTGQWIYKFIGEIVKTEKGWNFIPR